MAFDTRAYRVLVASPSDVVEERDAAVRVMHDWNNLHSHNRRVVLLPLRWETHTAPEYNVRPQEAINRRIVDDCDLVVGIFWTRLGSPTGEADSGTLEEIERAAKAGKPVMLYFSQVPVPPDRVDTDQIQRLRTFRDAVLASALVDSFRSALEFRDKFAAALELKIRDLQRADESGQPSPLDLQFVSLDDGRPLGPQLEVTLRVPNIAEPPAAADGQLKRHHSIALREAQHKAGTVPILLGIKNVGNVGIRNLFIEISIRPLDGACVVSASTPRHLAWSVSHDVVYSMGSTEGEVDPSDDYEAKLARLARKGLSEEGSEWKLRLEWEALQPQRVRFVEPLILFTSGKSGSVEIVAQVYAESFASPHTLKVHVVAHVEPYTPDTDALLRRAKFLQEAEAKQTTWVTFKDVLSSRFGHRDPTPAAEQSDAADRPPAGS